MLRPGLTHFCLARWILAPLSHWETLEGTWEAEIDGETDILVTALHSRQCYWPGLFTLAVTGSSSSSLLLFQHGINSSSWSIRDQRYSNNKDCLGVWVFSGQTWKPWPNNMLFSHVGIWLPWPSFFGLVFIPSFCSLWPRHYISPLLASPLWYFNIILTFVDPLKHLCSYCLLTVPRQADCFLYLIGLALRTNSIYL